MRPEGDCRRWYLAQVEAWGRGEEKKWRERGKKVVERYRDDRSGGYGQTRFNLLYSNVETLKGAVFSRVPKPDVRRRYVDAEGDPNDPEFRKRDTAEREAAEMIERALMHCVDGNEFRDAMSQARDDMLLPGRSVVSIEYAPDITRRPVAAVDDGMGNLVYVLDGQPVQPDGVDNDGFAFVEEKTNEKITWRYRYWEDFRLSPARCWDDVWGIAFRHQMTKSDVEDRFSAKVARDMRFDLDDAGRYMDEDSKDNEQGLRAEIWEIWDKNERKQIFVSRGYDEIIEENDDPLNLVGFFPTPHPLYAIKTTDSMVPIPEFCVYQDQADELDEISDRLGNLERSIKAVGLYNAVQEEIKNLRDMSDGQLYPVDDPQQLQATGGLRNNIWMMPIQDIAAVIVQLSARAEELKRQIYEISGISDLVRGATRASETATAQELKSRFGQLRMVPRADAVEQYIRSLYRMAGEVIVENFSPRTLKAMTGIGPADDVMQQLRQDQLRSYIVDIETEATVAIDHARERDEAIALTTAMTQFVQAWGPLVQAIPPTLPLAMEMMKFVFRRFKAGRSFEETVDTVAAQLQQIAAQPQQPVQAQPDPVKLAEIESRERIADMKVRGDLEGQRMRAEADVTGNVLDIAARPGASAI